MMMGWADMWVSEVFFENWERFWKIVCHIA
jgi:hypothetical protein